MKIWGVSEADIRDAAAEVGLKLYGDWNGDGVVAVGRALTARLAVDTTQPRNEAGLLPFQRLGRTPVQPRSGERSSRRLPYVCWHGHKRFMLAIFDRNPEARIQTTLADYRGREHFLSSHKATRGQGNDYNLDRNPHCGCGRHPTERRRRCR